MTSFSQRFRTAGAVFCSGLLCFDVCATAANLDTPTPAPAVTSGAPVPVQTTSFEAVTARLDRGGSFYLYLSAAQWLEGLSQEIKQWRDLAVPPDAAKTDADREKLTQAFDLAAALVKKSGLEQITGIGASSLALEPGIYRNTFFVHHEAGRETGLLNTLFGTAPHALTGLDHLPADTALATYSDLDAAGFIGTVRETLEQSGIPEVKQAIANGLAQFSLVTGMSFDDFLHSLGGSAGLILTLDPSKPVEVPMQGGKKQTIPAPRLAILIEVKDDRIFQRIEGLLGMFPMIQKVDEPDLRMLTMGIPALPQFNVRATIARWDKFLVLASDDQLVREIMAAQKTGQGFKASPAFAKLSAGMPAEGNGFSLMTRTFAEAARHFQNGILENQPDSTPGQMELMHRFIASQGVGATYGVSAHVADGWLSVGKGPQSLNKVVVPLMLVPIGIAAGIALPVFNTVQQQGKATKSLARAKQIGLACKLYAADHNGNFPPSLDALRPTYTDSDELFVSPFAPDEPAGYSYTPGLTTSAPGNTVLVEDKFAGRSKEKVVVHVDGSGEVTHVPGR